jgi:hypothetical protein
MKCPHCNEMMEVGDWPFCPHGSLVRQPAACHPSETCVLWQRGPDDIRWPGRNNRDMPAVYKNAGFERVEYRTLADLKRIEKKHHVTSEALNYDKGSGNGI